MLHSDVIVMMIDDSDDDSCSEWWSAPDLVLSVVSTTPTVTIKIAPQEFTCPID